MRLQLFPYHLSDYLCRVLRISPFRYYHDMMAALLKDERSYDRIPNFTVSRLSRPLALTFTLGGTLRGWP